MISALVLELSEPFKIVVENRLNTISPYVLLEQETWFEAEIPFFHKFLQPGMRVVDIGTNCGFYTLLAAHKVGAEGHVWGFEPGSMPARLLKEALRINNYSNVTLHEVAIGKEPGVVWFLDKEMSELSAVVESNIKGAREVQVESLDHLHQGGKIFGIDFIKIDAEGFEHQVITGGKEFFAHENPLVMLEIISDRGDNIGPAQLLQADGYELYRYCPGIGGLVPLVMDKIGDHILNIFLCKPDRAASLHAAGLLVGNKDLCKHLELPDPALFRNYFSELAVIKSCVELQNLLMAPVNPESEFDAIAAAFLFSQDSSRPLSERYSYLCKAERWIDDNFKDGLTLSQALSFSRIWHACGRFKLACGLLSLIAEGKSGIPLQITEPFILLEEKWERIPAKDGALFPWLISMVIEHLETTRSFSSIYQASATRDTYKLLREYGYLTPELERRAALVTLVSEGGQEFPDPVYIAGNVSRNRIIWNEIAQRLSSGEKEITMLTGAIYLEGADAVV